MVRKNKSLFECEQCKMWYPNRELAQKCEQWCKVHHSCNLEITQHSV